jgi:hypothetical protein
MITYAIVYQGIKYQGRELCALETSTIGEIVICPSFASTSLYERCVIPKFVRDGDEISFEILLHAVAADIHLLDAFR